MTEKLSLHRVATDCFPSGLQGKNMKELSVNYSLLSTILSRDLSMLFLPQPFPLAFIFLFLVGRFQNNPRAEQRLNQFGWGGEDEVYHYKVYSPVIIEGRICQVNPTIFILEINNMEAIFSLNKSQEICSS